MFPERRLRRLRKRTLQPLFKETRLAVSDLVMPLFFDETIEEAVPIGSMPGQYRYPLADAGAVAERLQRSGLSAVLVFGIPREKDAVATSAYDDDGVVQKAVAGIKQACPDLVVITDVCACEYTDHGHCGIVGETCGGGMDLLNDPSLALMQKIAVSHARAGADIVAPSCMLDGMVGAIRTALDGSGFAEVPIMSYSTKFASAYYGPFREAADSGFSFGDRTTYQMDPANAREALLESEEDAAEGADILMVKPAGLYLDVLAEIREIGLPVAAYQVSGEYAQLKAASALGWLDERKCALEALTCIKRAGADLIITYYAEDAARWLHEER
ncbi:delta-aminolevulinic acid dehydratase [Methanofollis liminatans DSM 4140]|jgi:porphobilinogen synthase|uniref:Delta-aminolevulinic acid dehydratase n=1 Tax=Methanofollis liminatans DSM 4140 TaxID=28892 RepID=J0S8J8_9EURY|nr:porphobilinogen synthase [Methanofollis liminatans]EJG06909.1 delta-aminolevulinic acid dehydratase [Methanofollis liminatans DSM 4140]